MQSFQVSECRHIPPCGTFFGTLSFFSGNFLQKKNVASTLKSKFFDTTSRTLAPNTFGLRIYNLAQNLNNATSKLQGNGDYLQSPFVLGIIVLLYWYYYCIVLLTHNSTFFLGGWVTKTMVILCIKSIPETFAEDECRRDIQPMMIFAMQA